jgi:aspartate aminotransferase
MITYSKKAMNNKLNPQALRLVGQPMFRLLEDVKKLEAKGQDIVHFEIGDPDFNTPSAVVEACIRSLRVGQTHYTSSYGLTELREAIIDHTYQELGFKPSLEQVLIAPGASPLIYFVIQCLVKAHEEVIVSDPSFSTFYSVLNFLNIKTVRVPLKEEYGFRMNPQDLSKRITPQTKMVVLNSPHNPTGAVMTPAEIEAVCLLAKEHNFFILSDEVYHLMSYGVKVASPGVHDSCRERTIIINSFSKSFAMTGWLLGYIIGPEFLIERISLLTQTIISCVPSFIQWAGLGVFDVPDEEIKAMNEELRLRRDLLVDGLNQLPGVTCLKPQGAFYVFANIQGTGMTGEQFADLMLQEAGVALLPGSNFGQEANGYVRLCYAVNCDRIKEGLSRMNGVLSKRLLTSPSLKAL